MTTNEMVAKYGMPWFKETFGFKPKMIAGEYVDHRDSSKTITYGVTLVDVYNLISKYEKAEAESVVEDLKGLIKPVANKKKPVNVYKKIYG